MTFQHKNPCTCDKCRYSEDCDPVCKTCQGSKPIEQREIDGCLARCTFYESSMYEGENYCDEWEPRDGGGIAIIIDHEQAEICEENIGGDSMTLEYLIQANEERYNLMLHTSSPDKELEICRQTISALNICKYACDILRNVHERTNDWCEVMKEAELE